MPTEIPCSNRSGPHPTRLIVVIVALSIGIMANSTDYYSAEVIEQPDDFEITVDVSGCLPTVETKLPVHRIAISTEKGEEIAWVECLARTDCINNKYIFEYEQDRCESDTGDTGTRDNARDDAGGDDADAGDAATSCWVHEDWIVADEENGQCKGEFTVTVELADDTVYEAVYRQSFHDSGGYWFLCSVAAPGRSPRAVER